MRFEDRVPSVQFFGTTTTYGEPPRSSQFLHELQRTTATYNINCTSMDPAFDKQQNTPTSNISTTGHSGTVGVAHSRSNQQQPQTLL